MRNSILFLIAGVFCAATLSSVISVYVLLDVDRKHGSLNHEFAGLLVESVIFALFVGGATGLLTYVGRISLRLKSYAPRAKFSFLLGAGVTVVQYLWDWAARKFLPQLSDTALIVYLVAAVVVCTAALLHDNFRQKTMQGF